MYSTCQHFLETFDSATVDVEQPLTIWIENSSDSDMLITELETEALIREDVEEFTKSMREAYKSKNKTVERLCYRIENALARLGRKKSAFIPLYYPLDTSPLTEPPRQFGVYLWTRERIHLHFLYEKTNYTQLLESLFFYSCILQILAKRLGKKAGIIRGHYQHYVFEDKDTTLRDRIVEKYGLDD